jgi:8-oxo-dGTP diphosphatase
MEVPRSPIAGVGAVITNSAGQVALVRRGKAPREGQWSIPGGRIEWGETIEQALLREIMEETGLMVKLERLIDVVDFVARDASGVVTGHYVLIDFKAAQLSGELRAGSDAAEACWANPYMLEQYALWNETRRIIDAGLSEG